MITHLDDLSSLSIKESNCTSTTSVPSLSYTCFFVFRELVGNNEMSINVKKNDV